MFKLVRRLILLVIVLLLLLVAGIFYSDSILEKAVEAGGTRALGVETKLGKADLGLFTGSVELEWLVVANPEGFQERPFLEVASIATRISPAKLLGDEASEVDRLTIKDVRLRMERRDGRWNYERILENLERLQGGEEERSGRRFIIRRLEILDVAVSLDVHPVTALLGDRLKTLRFPRLELRDVGAEKGEGVAVADLAGILVQAVLGAAAPLLPGDAGGRLRARLTELLRAGGRSLDILGASGTEGGGGGLLKGLGGLLQGGSNKEKR